MKMKAKKFQLAVVFVILTGLGLHGSSALARGQIDSVEKIDTSRNLSRHFTPATSVKKAPDEKGFIQRWLVLEPFNKNISRNSIFTDSYLRTTLSNDNFSDDFTVIPKKDEKVKIGDQELKWYALDSKRYDFSLFNLAYAINKPQNGVLFWVVSVINCPKEIKNVRLSAGCNSAGMFWLNGEEAIMLSGNRDMVVDNVTSNRVTLKKGKNVIRGAIINGPGIIDFSVRFLDEEFKPLDNFTISYE